MTMKLSRDELERRAETFRLKAMEEHQACRDWQRRALEAEQRLAECICGKPQRSQQQPTLWEQS
ncbi:UNVERIFIED_ORG: hypothetical protein J2X79_000237 [Arthrobacter globiformis]|nr:hypothetical protein [Arthrobacter globiformis]